MFGRDEKEEPKVTLNKESLNVLAEKLMHIECGLTSRRALSVFKRDIQFSLNMADRKEVLRLKKEKFKEIHNPIDEQSYDLYVMLKKQSETDYRPVEEKLKQELAKKMGKKDNVEDFTKIKKKKEEEKENRESFKQAHVRFAASMGHTVEEFEEFGRNLEIAKQQNEGTAQDTIS